MPNVTRRSVLLLAAGAPSPAAPPVRRATLFRQLDAGVHTYRIPALIETRGGTLLAVADARPDSARDLPARISLVGSEGSVGRRKRLPHNPESVVYAG